METVLSISAVVLAIFACIIVGISYRRLNGIPHILGKYAAQTVKTLDPKKRYIIALPSTMSDSEFDEAFSVIEEHLGLTTSDTHIIIMHGDVTMVEFS